MGQKAQALRERIIEAADKLFYQQGYENTTFSDISEAVQISRGNFYYHFKTKDEILDAVITARVIALENMFASWAQDFADPQQRIEHYIDVLTENQENIKKHGCPIGSLCSELAKLSHHKFNNASRLFGVTRDWLVQQLRELGITSDPEGIAMHIMARSQGVAAITNAFEDNAFLNQEVRQLKTWLDELIKSQS